MIKNYTDNDCNDNTPNVPACTSTVVDSETLSECDNRYYVPMGRPGYVVAKIPVVLSEVKVQIDTEAEIRLQTPAYDIKTIDKHVFIKQCKLVPYTNKLFIAGYVEKNIQYSTVACANATSISGNIQHTTIRIPFKCVTAIRFANYPIYGGSYKERINVLDKKMLGKDMKEDSWYHFNEFYEPVFCELEYAEILETDLYDHKDCHHGCHKDNYDNDTFQDLTEKMVIYVRLKVLQKQQVYIHGPYGPCKDITMEKEDNAKEKLEKQDEYMDIEVGYDPENGLMGRELKDKAPLAKKE